MRLLYLYLCKSVLLFLLCVFIHFSISAQNIRSASGTLDQSYILPVVVHIVNPNPAGITDAQVIAAINDLNDAFGKTGVYASGVGVNTKIQFCLAKKNPEGGNSTGITRTVSDFIGTNLNKFIEDVKLKNLNRWDPSRYINIWIITSTNVENITRFGCGVWTRISEAGYATFPGTDPLTDGIVLAGITPGTAVAHEMGHYLSLYHTFEGLNCANNDCSTDGDHVCDTPPDASYSNSPSCSSPQNSCTSDTASKHSNGFFPIDVPDMISNFMDYGNDACHNAFTEGQAERMRTAIATQRTGLLQNECNKPCADNSVASFTRDIVRPVPGQTISFTNTCSGATQYQWLVNDVVVSTATRFSTSFPALGTYKLTLKAYNGNLNCFASYTDFVIVSCGVNASFYADKNTIASKIPVYADSISFINNSTNGLTYIWLVSFNGAPEQVVGTGVNEIYIFPAPGNYTMRLVASNGGCSDTTEYYPVTVADPTPDGLLYINDVQCYEKTKLRVVVQFCNSGFAPIPANMPVTFYDDDPRNGNAHQIGNTFFFPDSVPGSCCSNGFADTLDVKKPGLNKLWGVLNDKGKSNPFTLPGTSLQEISYLNNFASANNFQFHISITPASPVVISGDSLQLGENINPASSVISSYLWSPAIGLTCTDCPNPYFIAAKKDASKQLIAISSYGCADTADVLIQVLPADDFTITIDSILCGGNDSLVAEFTLCNLFKRGMIPQGLQVSFYDADPSVAGAHLLGPVFVTPVTTNNKCGSFTFSINGMGAGKIFAAVNNSENQVPVVFPQDTLYLEKDYSNNISSFNYRLDSVLLQPADTTVFRKQSIPVTILSPIDDPLSTTWLPGDGYTLSCTTCPSSLVTVLDNSIVRMQTTNAHGCLIHGEMKINIFPPDMVVRLVQSDCYTNNSTRVKFSICMNNGYDSVFKGIPVSFYDGDPSTGNAHILRPTFYTEAFSPSSCDSFVHVVSTPQTGKIYAVVNDKGENAGVVPEKSFDETDYTNDTSSMEIIPFVAGIHPEDTTVFRNNPVQIMASVTGNQSYHFTWEPSSSLSCTDCLTPVATPPYSIAYAFIARNEFGCTDTLYANIKTFAGGRVDIPNAFTPNGDGNNDVFYILGSQDIQSIRNFSIFNRVGQKIFGVENVPANDPRFGWNGSFSGRLAPPETYVYFAIIRFTDGTEQQFKGTVILVR